MGLWRYLIFAAIIVLLGWGILGVIGQKSEFSADAEALQAELTLLDSENQALEEDLAYYANPENLVKALKEQFNYRAPGEKLIILVNPSTSSAPSAE